MTGFVRLRCERCKTDYTVDRVFLETVMLTCCGQFPAPSPRT